MLEDLLQQLKSRPFTLSTSKGSRGKRVWCVSYLGEDLIGDNLVEVLTKVLADFIELEGKVK